MSAARIYLWIALAAILTACGKGDPSPAPKALPKAAATAAPAVPAKSGEIDEALKERLARQEAAAKMFESKVLNPSPPAPPKAPPEESKAAAVPPAPQAAPTPVAAAAPPKSEPPKTELPKVGAPKVEPPKAEPSRPATPPSAPASAPRTDLAAARPTQAPAPEAPATRLVSRVDPEFPREAASAGYEQGNVKARMTLDATGSVSRVEILAANPRRVFDRAVTRALSQWRYSAGAEGRTVDMEVDFRR